MCQPADHHVPQHHAAGLPHSAANSMHSRTDRQGVSSCPPRHTR
jgi:hypothetical protein